MKLSTLLIESNQFNRFRRYAQTISTKLGIHPDTLLKMAMEIDQSDRKNLTQWILKILGEYGLDSLDRIRQAINDFNRFKIFLPQKDINSYTKLEDLEETIKSYKLVKGKNSGGTGASLLSYPGVSLYNSIGEIELYKITDPDTLADITEGTSLCVRRSYPGDSKANEYINTYGAIYVLLNKGVVKAYITSTLSEVNDPKNDEYLTNDLDELRLIISVSRDNHKPIVPKGYYYIINCYIAITGNYEILFKEKSSANIQQQNGILYIFRLAAYKKAIIDNEIIDYIAADASDELDTALRSRLHGYYFSIYEDISEIAITTVFNILSATYQWLKRDDIDVSEEYDNSGILIYKVQVEIDLLDKHPGNAFLQLPIDLRLEIGYTLQGILFNGQVIDAIPTNDTIFKLDITKYWLRDTDVDIKYLDDIPFEILNSFRAIVSNDKLVRYRAIERQGNRCIATLEKAAH